MAILWLMVLVILAAILLVLWLVAHSRLEKPLITLIEPLFLLTKSWQIARFSGNGTQVEAALRVLSATKTADGELERILPPVKGKLPVVVGVESRKLPLIGEQKLIQEGDKKTSFIIGLASEVIPQLLLTAKEQKELLQLEETAGGHGFLVLAVGRTAVHGSGEKLTHLQHVYLGAVLLEPVLNASALKKVAAITGNKRIVTVLPPTFASWLAIQAGLSGPVFSPTGQETAEKFEKKVTAAAMITSANYDARYRAIRCLQQTYKTVLWSQRAQDQSLPVKLFSV